MCRRIASSAASASSTAIAARISPVFRDGIGCHAPVRDRPEDVNMDIEPGEHVADEKVAARNGDQAVETAVEAGEPIKGGRDRCRRRKPFLRMHPSLDTIDSAKD